MSEHFPEPYVHFGGNINVKVDLSDYATKTDLKKAIGVGTSKSDIASLKPEADKLDIEKLETVPVDMSKLSSVVNNEFVKKKQKKTVYNKIRSRKKNQCHRQKTFLILVDLRKLNAKITETEGKIPSITGLATTTALTAVENKILNGSNLVKKNAKIFDI